MTLGCRFSQDSGASGNDSSARLSRGKRFSRLGLFLGSLVAVDTLMAVVMMPFVFGSFEARDGLLGLAAVEKSTRWKYCGFATGGVTAYCSSFRSHMWTTQSHACRVAYPEWQ